MSTSRVPPSGRRIAWPRRTSLMPNYQCTDDLSWAVARTGAGISEAFLDAISHAAAISIKPLASPKVSSSSQLPTGKLRTWLNWVAYAQLS